MNYADESIRWARRSAFRVIMFRAVLYLNKIIGILPSAALARKHARHIHYKRVVNMDCQSGRSNAGQAVRDLIDRGFLVNDGKRGRMALRVAGVVSDMLEEEGRPRLEEGDYL